MRYTDNQGNRIMFVIAVILIGLLVFPLDSNANEQDKELELTRVLLTKGKEFFNKGNYSAAVEMLKEFIEKGNDKKNQLKNEYAQAYYILARIYFDAEELENLEENLKNLFQTDLNYVIPGSDDAKLKEKAELIRLEIEKTRKISVNFSPGDIDGPVYVAFFELDQKNMKEFPHPQKITLELPKPGTYAFYFVKDDKYITVIGKVSNHQEKAIDFKNALEIPILKQEEESIEGQAQGAKKVSLIKEVTLVPAHNQGKVEAKIDAGFDDKVRLELILELEPYDKDKVKIFLEKPLSREIAAGENCTIEKGKIVLRLSPTDLPSKISGNWKLRIENKYADKDISLKKAELYFYPEKEPNPPGKQQEK
jgi:tetratricopeptide (TPR) repeat protein